LCLLIANSAYGEVFIDKEVTYYDISGLTSHSLRREMSKKGPRIELNPRRYAMTKWKVVHDIDYVDMEHGCQVRNVDITLSIQYIYPHWINREDAHPQVRARWDGFYRALVEYEEMHANNAIEAANELEKELINLSNDNNRWLTNRYTCEHFQKQANSRIQKIVLDYINNDIYLDRVTNFGDSRGVWLP